MDSGDHLQKMLQNTVNQNPQPTAMHRLEAVFGKFLDVQGVTGSSPVSSTKTKTRNRNGYGFFLLYFSRVFPLVFPLAPEMFFSSRSMWSALDNVR